MSDSAFAPTRWTRIVEARGETPEARAALSDLCEAYYGPVLAFLKRERVGDAEAARELAQEFFRRLLAGAGVTGADPERGKFRSFLLGAVKHFLADQHDHTRRQKRGAGAIHEPLEPGTDSAPGLDPADTRTVSPDVEFDRQWALTVLDRAFVALEGELTTEGKAAHLEVLQPWLTGAADHGAQLEAAQTLGLSETAVRVAVHRLRKRYREAVRSELRQTLSPGESVETELKHLFAALAG
ncbi:MAG: sigma-70 family RNA polymerase sigma factor [Chthoniobacteraceae bacterium]